jgi:hypothetical protein
VVGVPASGLPIHESEEFLAFWSHSWEAKQGPNGLPGGRERSRHVPPLIACPLACECPGLHVRQESGPPQCHSPRACYEQTPCGPTRRSTGARTAITGKQCHSSDRSESRLVFSCAPRLDTSAAFRTNHTIVYLRMLPRSFDQVFY